MVQMLRLWLCLIPFLSTTHARRKGRAGLRWICLALLIGLILQFALGMILNLYGTIPTADARASYLQEIETAPGMLTAHALLGLLVLAAAAILLLKAIALRDMTVITLVAAGLAALLGAFAAGEMFVKNGENSASLSMAILTGAALLCYTSLQAILGGRRPLAPREGTVAHRADVRN
jgi:heme A synthase